MAIGYDVNEAAHQIVLDAVGRAQKRIATLPVEGDPAYPELEKQRAAFRKARQALRDTAPRKEDKT